MVVCRAHSRHRFRNVKKLVPEKWGASLGARGGLRDTIFPYVWVLAALDRLNSEQPTWDPMIGK